MSGSTSIQGQAKMWGMAVIVGTHIVVGWFRYEQVGIWGRYLRSQVPLRSPRSFLGVATSVPMSLGVGGRYLWSQIPLGG